MRHTRTLIVILETLLETSTDGQSGGSSVAANCTIKVLDVPAPAQKHFEGRKPVTKRVDHGVLSLSILCAADPRQAPNPTIFNNPTGLSLLRSANDSAYDSDREASFRSKWGLIFVF